MFGQKDEHKIFKKKRRENFSVKKKSSQGLCCEIFSRSLSVCSLKVNWFGKCFPVAVMRNQKYIPIFNACLAQYLM